MTEDTLALATEGMWTKDTSSEENPPAAPHGVVIDVPPNPPEPIDVEVP